MSIIKQIIAFIILKLTFLFTKGKGTYVEITTDMFSDVHVNKGDVGVICKKELRDEQIYITIDFIYRFLVCGKEHYKIITEKEYVSKVESDITPIDLTHLVDKEISPQDDIFSKSNKSSRRTFH